MLTSDSNPNPSPAQSTPADPAADDESRSSKPHHEAPLKHNPSPALLELSDPQSLLSEPELQSIQSWTKSVFELLDATGSIRAKVVNDDQMSTAHQQFSGIEGTTDVLTFDLNPEYSTENKLLDTDLIICYDEAQRQAKEHNHTTAQELLLYIIHGTLHCLGYNDHTDEDFKAMHAKEDQLLTQAGIGPLFHNNTFQQTSDQSTDQSTNPGTNP